MNIPIEISFRGVPKSGAVEDLIREKATKLERFCDHISSCRVAVEKPHEAGAPFRVRIDVRVPPGHELVVKREFDGTDLGDRLPAILRDAFSSMSRSVKDLVDKRREP